MTIKNGDLPAMPVLDESREQQYNGVTTTVHSVLSYGLTKREQFAAQFMAAWIIHHGAANNYGYNKESAANDAIDAAETLLAALERTK